MSIISVKLTNYIYRTKKNFNKKMWKKRNFVQDDIFLRRMRMLMDDSIINNDE